MYVAPPNPQTLPTEPDIKQTSSSPSLVQPSAPTSLKVLLSFVVIQILFAIGVLVVKIVFGYIGFNGNAPLAVDQANCGNYSALFKYESSQKYIMMISLVMVAVCILFSTIILIIVSKAVHQSKKLPAESYTVSSPSLTISTLYRVVGPKTRAFLYILQSICMLGAITVLGYYLAYFIQMKKYSCSWTNDADTSTKILVVWAIAAALFVVGWIVWIIIVSINIQNRSDQVYQEEEKPEVKNTTYNNINTTEMNSITYDNTRKQFVPPPEEKNSYRYYNPTRKDTEKDEPLNKVRTLDSEKQQYAIKEPNNEKKYYYHSPGTPKNENKNVDYKNPVFGEKKELYGSPYDRIQNGRFYEGDRDRDRDLNRNEVRPQMMPIHQNDKEKEFHRSRFNSNNNYDSYNSYEKESPVKESDQYIKALSRHRLEQQEKEPYKSNGSRQYLPQSIPSSSKNFEGSGKPKLHSNYFKDEGSMLNKKRERKGILNDYIRGKYADN